MGLDPPHGKVGSPLHRAGAAAEVDGQRGLRDVDVDGLVLVRPAEGDLLSDDHELDSEARDNVKPVKAVAFTNGYDGDTLVGMLRVVIK